MNGASLRGAVIAATQELEAAGIPDAARDARLLVAFAAGLPKDRLTLELDSPIDRAALTRLEQAMTDRLARKPVSHILGGREFWGRWFDVGPAVLDPRPETEILIEAALAKPYDRVLDLGTGSGCILLTLLAERDGATGVGAELSEEALEVAVANRARLGLNRQAVFTISDWLSGVVGQFDLVVANPPYISLPEMASLAPEVLKWEPMSALTPGFSGLEAYEAIADGIGEFLTGNARILLEIGPTQADAVTAIFRAVGLAHLATHPDLDGRDRVVELQRTS